MSLGYNTTYYWRLSASNAGGTSPWSETWWFTTEPRTYTITPCSPTNGSISPSSPVTVVEGNSQTFTTTPNACYGISNVLVDGQSVGALSSYTFSNVTGDHTICATFTQLSYAITASAGTGGTISPSGSVSVNCGSSQPFTISPSACYRIADVLVNGASVGAISSYTFTNVTGNQTISASFTLLTYTITASAGTGGSISPSDSVPVACGGSLSRATTIPQVKGLQGQMIPQFQGQMIPQFQGQMIPQF